MCVCTLCDEWPAAVRLRPSRRSDSSRTVCTDKPPHTHTRDTNWCRVTRPKLRGCVLNVKMSKTWDGIHHGTRQGDTESPEYGDLSAVWGEKGPPGKPYLGTLWGTE